MPADNLVLTLEEHLMAEQYVSFILAHPLRTVDAVELGLPERVYQQGEKVTLMKREAMRLVGAGFVLGADPADRDSVRAALVPVKNNPKPAVQQGKSE
ncbi:hypothetical protein [Planomonospora sp. ID82291]|uniref:hypothetical protein n=1 Tax=Planomonospora sp. ID82291 TaxID=2738136 RepID=UPI0018C44120|nr:hypothetical protein [Planomonospora sp. ID82291]MBG0818992.1 hypothetical protein [Planomonospora sp. ID82291]